jgi:hypothetical protein
MKKNVIKNLLLLTTVMLFLMSTGNLSAQTVQSQKQEKTFSDKKLSTAEQTNTSAVDNKSVEKKHTVTPDGETIWAPDHPGNKSQEEAAKMVEENKKLSQSPSAPTPKKE